MNPIQKKPIRQTSLCVVLMLVLLALFIRPAQAEGPLPFTQGNESYEAGNFEGAVIRYREQVASGPWSANLFFNLGNAHYYLGEKGAAALAYERALVLEPSHPEAQANLKLLRQETGAQILEETLWDKWLLYPVKYLRGATAWVAALGVWCFVFLLVIWFYRASLKSQGRGLLWMGMSAVSLLLAFWCTLGIYLEARAGERWVITKDKVTVRAAPADASKSLAGLVQGSQVRLILERGSWLYVTLPNHQRGWLSRTGVERVAISKGQRGS